MLSKKSSLSSLPYGERWLEMASRSAYNLPYAFTGKPLDDETNYYYFGARYYDSVRSHWLTSDPALNEYFDDITKGEGGVYDYINLNTYHYAENEFWSCLDMFWGFIFY